MARTKSPSQTALTRRYLVWCYKTTKESLDRIDRKFTQATVDRFILDELSRKKPSGSAKEDYKKLVDDFKIYIEQKENEGLRQKFVDGRNKELHPEYLYLTYRLEAVESAIRHFLGPQELPHIHRLYEEEFTRRILESKEH
jgi:hypothetical protein